MSEFTRGFLCAVCVLVAVRHTRRFVLPPVRARWAALRERVALAFHERGGW